MNHSVTSTYAESVNALRERILLSAIEEFGRHNYEVVSTNAIVHNAGVSKGLLFHYFGSKKNLFSACIAHIFSYMNDYYRDRLRFTDADVFARIRIMLQAKMDFFKENPLLMQLANRLWDSGHKSEIEEHIRHLTGDAAAGQSRKSQGIIPDQSYFFLVKDADTSKFNDDSDPDIVVGYIEILLNASWNRFAGKYDNDAHRIAENLEDYLDEADAILELVKFGAYK